MGDPATPGHIVIVPVTVKTGGSGSIAITALPDIVAVQPPDVTVTV